jgi:hypothetical protein
MRAAIECLPFESPKLVGVGVGYLNALPRVRPAIRTRPRQSADGGVHAKAAPAPGPLRRHDKYQPPRIARKFLQLADRTPDHITHKAAKLAAARTLSSWQSHNAHLGDSNRSEPLSTCTIIGKRTGVTLSDSVRIETFRINFLFAEVRVVFIDRLFQSGLVQWVKARVPFKNVGFQGVPRVEAWFRYSIG